MNKVCHNCGIQISETAKFCTGCGSELQHKTSQPIPQSPSIIKSAKKGFGVGAKIGLGLGVILFIIIAIGAAGSVSHISTNTDTSDSTSLDQQAIGFVQKYKGPNNNGDSVSQILTLIVDLTYPNENILDNPSTEHGWTSTKVANQNGNVWEVDFDMKTYRENVRIVWYANLDTLTVSPGDTTAKNILDIVNNPHNSVSNDTLSKIHLT